jgi:predicted  nucleic acid-binding Zn-ribbon protein
VSVIELLTRIRDGVHQLRADLVSRIDQTNARLDQTNAKLDRTNAKLDQTRTEFLAKLEETRADLAGQIGQTNERLDQTNERLGRLERSVSTLTGHVGTLADRGLRIEDDVADLRRRVEVLESRRDE